MTKLKDSVFTLTISNKKLILDGLKKDCSLDWVI